MAREYTKPEHWYRFGSDATTDDLVLSGEGLKLLEANMKAQEAAKAAREKLETYVTGKIGKFREAVAVGDDMVPVFGYRFGPSFGFVPADAKTTRGAGKKRLGIKL